MTSSQTSSLPLVMATVGQRVRIVSIAAGQKVTHRLVEMGLHPGCEVEIIQNQDHGPLLIGKGDTRLALCRGIAHKVIVQPTAAETQPTAIAPTQPTATAPTQPTATAPRSMFGQHGHCHRMRGGAKNAG